MRHSPSLYAGAIVVGGFLALAAASASAPWQGLRERVFDWMLGLTAPRRGETAVVVVDIDRGTLEQRGAWPWPRTRLADLIETIAAGKPRALVVDVLLEGADDRSPAALASRLIEAVPGLAPQLKAAPLADGDAVLAESLARVPSVLGLALAPEKTSPPHAAAPIISRGKPDLSGLWKAPGTIGPDRPLADAGAGLGVLALPGDADGQIRRVPLLVTAGQVQVPGLAMEAIRVAADASSYLLTATPLRLAAGDAGVRLPADGMLRLRPSFAGLQSKRTISAADLLADTKLARRLEGRIVLLGTSAPEAGGLRSAATGLLVPSVQLQADAVTQILAGDSPRRPRGLWLLEGLVAAGLCALAAMLGFRWTPFRGGTAALATIAAWGALCLAALRFGSLLLDPLLPMAVVLLAHPIAAFGAATDLRRREEGIRRRFEQHLSPDVVRRLAEKPDLVRLEGEAREVTALFTDIEGFTDLTERAGPATLVGLLDRYFEGATRIVVEHGGMIEKFVGDALHVLFNAPLDLEGHPARAIACAGALLEFTEQFRAEPDAKALAFGRTRIGIETGMVIVGDVGGGRRLDYTAYGRAMNMAARLEAANKDLGSSICIGPVTAARVDASMLRPLGPLSLKGIPGTVAVFEPWPASYREPDRRLFLSALSLLQSAPNAARARFATLAQTHPADAVAARLAAPASGKT